MVSGHVKLRVNIPAINIERFHMTSRRSFWCSTTAAMLVFQTNPVEVELFSNVSAFFCPNEFV